MKIEMKRQQVEKDFDRIASDYDRCAVLMQHMGQQILQRLRVCDIEVKHIVDLGCATGFFNADLKKQFPHAEILSIDISQCMLKQSRVLNKLQSAAEQLPIKGSEIDVIFANGLLPFCEDVNAVFSECRRVLKTNGLLFFSSFGPDNGLPDMHDVGDALIHAGFVDPVMEVERLQIDYPSIEAMQEEMQGAGLHRFENKKVTAEFEIIYGHAWCGDKHVATMNAAGEASILVQHIK